MSDEKLPPAIDLARTPDFSLGALMVCPSLRQVVRKDVRESLEPRVMQVLVALAQAQGAVVSRDELIARCWEGRVVGEDAINRAIGRLRRLAETSGAYKIDTIARVGYRLVTVEQPVAIRPPPAPDETPPVPAKNRRWWIGAGGAAIAAAGAGAWFWPRRGPAISSDVVSQLFTAKQLFRQGMIDTGSQAAAILERLAATHPNIAAVWGGLAGTYAFQLHTVTPDSQAVRLRALAAIRRARTLDPHDPSSYVAEAYLVPNRGHWWERENVLREGLRFHPQDDDILMALGQTLFMVGRVNEAADTMNRAVTAAGALDPSLSWLQIATLDAAGRLPEADQAAAAGIAMFPRHIYVWFSRLYLFMFSGRLDEARAMLADTNGRPLAVPAAEFDQLVAVVNALQTNAPTDIDNAIAVNVAMAHRGAGLAENLICYASALGRLDFAFQVANGLFFDRGFRVGNLRFTAEQGAYTPLSDRRTDFLFRTPAKALRKDARFAALAQEVGLEDYWKKAGVQPDFRHEG
jgi:DNA-binding winged helix-turn-helix (wHTH) protein/Flp pilus assembly protein TadD